MVWLHKNEKYNEKAKLPYIGTNIFNVSVKTEDIDEEIAKDTQKIFDTSHFEL